MRIFGVVGYPISHSLSPVMHNAAFQALGLDALYATFPIPPTKLRPVVRGLVACGLDGFNVTIPHKEAIVPLLDVCDADAKALGAVNTVVVCRGKTIGYNTDVAGFTRALKELGRHSGPPHAATILGAGGAARAVAWALSRTPRTRLTIVNRHVERAWQLARWLRRRRPRISVRVQPLRRVSLADQDLLVNVTSVGMRAGDPSPVDLAGCPKTLLVYDLVYHRVTPLVRQARRHGCVAQNGLAMLLYQGAEAFRVWTHRRPPIEVMRRALEQQFR